MYHQLLEKFKDMFSWDYNDMIGLDPTFVNHNFVV